MAIYPDYDNYYKPSWIDHHVTAKLLLVMTKDFKGKTVLNKQEKEELLRERLLSLKGNLEVAMVCLNYAIQNLQNLDDFQDILKNWEKYKDLLDE